MQRKLILALLIALLLVFVVGCKPEETIPETSTEKSSTEDESILKIEEELLPVEEPDFPVQEDAKGPQVQIRRVCATKDLEHAYFEYPELLTDSFPELAAALEEFSREERERYLTQLKEEFTEATFIGPYAYFTKDVSVSFCNDQLISFQMIADSYNGIAAHGMKENRAAIFLVETGERVTLDTLGDIKQDVYDYVMECLGPNDSGGYVADYAEKVKSLLDAEDHWYLTPAGIGISFSDCEISSYAAGAPTVVVPYDKLSGLKEEYRWKDAEEVLAAGSWNWEEKMEKPLVTRETWEYPATEIFSGNYTGIRYAGEKYPNLKNRLDAYYQDSLASFVAKAEKAEQERAKEDLPGEARYAEAVSVTWSNSDLLSARIYCYEHTGRLMEEGSASYWGITFDVNTGEVVTLDQLGDIKDEVAAYLIEYVEKYYSRDTGWELSSDYEAIIRKCLEGESIWHLTDAGICFEFGDGVLGKYSISVEIPYDRLEGLKEEYRREDYYLNIAAEKSIPVVFGDKEYVVKQEIKGLRLNETEEYLDFPASEYDCCYVNYGGDTYLLAQKQRKPLLNKGGWIGLYRWNGDKIELADEWIGYDILTMEDAHHLVIGNSEGKEYLCEMTKDGIRRIAER